jgi:NitT/TauT family transport system permease protein
MTVMRVLGGFILACIIAVPLGILMGSYKLIEAFLSPSFRFAATCPHRRLSPCLFCGQGLAKCKKYW